MAWFNVARMGWGILKTIVVFLMGGLSGLAMVMVTLLVLFMVTTSVRQTWRKNRAARTALPPGRKDCSKFPKVLFDKPWEAMYPVPKSKISKKQLRAFLSAPPKENKGLEELWDGDLLLWMEDCWFPEYVILSSDGVLSIFGQDEEQIGEVKLSGCIVRPAEDDSELSFIIEHTAMRPIFSVYPRRADMSTPTLPLALKFGDTHWCMFRAENADAKRDWTTSINKLIQELPPFGYNPERSYPYFKKNARVEDATFLQVLLDRIFTDIQKSPAFEEDIHKTIKKKIDDVNLPSFVGPIVVEKIDPGEHMLEVEAIASHQEKDSNEFLLQAYIRYSGGAGADISTELVLGKGLGISLDISVRLKKLEGVINLHAPDELGELWSLFFPVPPEEDNFHADVNIKIGGINICYVIPMLKKFLNSCVYRAIGFVLTYPSRVTVCLPFPGRKMDPDPDPYETTVKTKRVGHRRTRPTDSENNENINRKFVVGDFFLRVLNGKDLSAVQDLVEPNITVTGLLPYFYSGQWETVGPLAMRQALQHFFDAFSDARFFIMDMGIPRIGFGNPHLVQVRFRVRGVHDKEPLWNIRMLALPFIPHIAFAFVLFFNPFFTRKYLQ